MGRRGFKPVKRLGQHFLVDEGVADFIVSQIPLGSTVLEIGGGTGVLTRRLVRRASKVYAIELDRRLAEILGKKVPEAEVIVGDALKVEWPPVDWVVSNIPYGITGLLIPKVLKFRRPAVLTVQKEVAERLAAVPRTYEYGRLTVLTQCLAEVERLLVVRPEAFYPRPKVYSAVVRLMPKSPCTEDIEGLEDLTRRLFSWRRRTVRVLVKRGIIPPVVDESLRVYELSIQDIVKILEALNREKKSATSSPP